MRDRECKALRLVPLARRTFYKAEPCTPPVGISAIWYSYSKAEVRYPPLLPPDWQVRRIGRLAGGDELLPQCARSLWERG